MNVDEQLQRAMESHQSGRLAEAQAICRRVLAYRPNCAQAYYILGVIAGREGKPAEAVELLSKATFIDAFKPEFYFNLVLALGACGRLDDAAVAYQRMEDLGLIRWDLYNGMALAFRKAGRLDDAIEMFRRALRIEPDFFDAMTNLGLCLSEKGELDAAFEVCNNALSLRPQSTEVLINMCSILAAQGRAPEALGAIERAIALEPELAVARQNRGQLLLLMGELSRGWKEYRWRWRTDNPELGVKVPRHVWEGQPLHDKPILLLAEQGLGDGIQFMRYVPMVAQRGGRVIVACRQPLISLLKTVEGVTEVADGKQPLPVMEFVCPLLDLPGVFNTDLSSIPAKVPYLSADSAKSAAWKERLNPYPGLKVGLVWSGGRSHNRDRYRSISLNSLLPLSLVENTHFFSLQKGEAAADVSSAPSALRLTDWTAELNDMADTAALIDNLDLVISIDTSVAHLAGAMAKKVWVLIPFAPDWRWMLSRADSPWYPTMRLFRQPTGGDWETPIHQVLQALRSFA